VRLFKEKRHLDAFHMFKHAYRLAVLGKYCLALVSFVGQSMSLGQYGTLFEPFSGFLFLNVSDFFLAFFSIFHHKA
jgi:hypothetical protein